MWLLAQYSTLCLFLFILYTFFPFFLLLLLLLLLAVVSSVGHGIFASATTSPISTRSTVELVVNIVTCIEDRMVHICISFWPHSLGKWQSMAVDGSRWIVAHISLCLRPQQGRNHNATPLTKHKWKSKFNLHSGFLNSLLNSIYSRSKRNSAGWQQKKGQRYTAFHMFVYRVLKRTFKFNLRNIQIELAFRCLHSDSDERQRMATIVWPSMRRDPFLVLHLNYSHFYLFRPSPFAIIWLGFWGEKSH